MGQDILFLIATGRAIFQTMERFWQYILQAPNCGFPDHILLEKCNNLDIIAG
ncbi:hypothetical protein HAX54_043436, partial [Datura stramonium]|nr:hypothetical protein [Datura stramonium]